MVLGTVPDDLLELLSHRSRARSLPGRRSRDEAGIAWGAAREPPDFEPYLVFLLVSVPTTSFSQALSSTPTLSSPSDPSYSLPWSARGRSKPDDADSDPTLSQNITWDLYRLLFNLSLVCTASERVKFDSSSVTFSLMRSL